MPPNYGFTDNDRRLLIRLEERMKGVERDVTEVKEKFDDYTPLIRFQPIERAVFFVIMLVATAIIGSVLGIVIKGSFL